MVQRIPHILTLCILFGSMWIQSSIPVFQGDHRMMDQSCLEHCLDALHVKTVDAGIVVLGVTTLVTSVGQEPLSILDSSDVQIKTQSHHDPGRILKTIKRE